MTRAATLVLALVTLVVAGCTAIPTSGPVEEVPVSAEPRGIDIAPQPPEHGVEPGRLIEGFLQAMASPEGDYGVAREYLTIDAAEEWDPQSATIVDASLVDEEGDSAVTGTRIGALDAVGHFTSDSGGFTQGFGLVEEDGEWRISQPPEGLLLTRYIFERYYRTVTLYFMDVSGSHVVPDPIHVPEAQVTPNAIVAAALEGPSSGISAAVTDAIPNGVYLGTQGATIDSDGVVTVNLMGLSSALGDDARRRLGAQLMWSLTGVSRATGLLVTSGGGPFTLPGARADGVLELASQQGYQVLSRASTTDLFAISEGQPGRVTSAGRFEAWGGVDSQGSDLAVSLDGELAALVISGEPRVLLGIPGGAMEDVSLEQTRLRHPQFALGTLWLLGDGADGRPLLVTVAKTGAVTVVQVDLPDGAQISDFAVSPTGARAALLVTTGDTTRLGVATVVPGPDVSVQGWSPLHLTDDTGAAITDVTAVSWQAEASMAISGAASGIGSVYTVEIDGSVVDELGPFAGEVAQLTAMPRLGGGAVAVRTLNDVVWRYEARTRWTRLAENVTAVAFAS